MGLVVGRFWKVGYENQLDFEIQNREQFDVKGI